MGVYAFLPSERLKLGNLHNLHSSDRTVFRSPNLCYPDYRYNALHASIIDSPFHLSSDLHQRG